MPYTNWPNGVGSYTPDTHITDRVSKVNHISIKDGLAKDIANIQSNINTTNLFASGWIKPVVSGWFANIDTNDMYVHTLHTNILDINNGIYSVSLAKVDADGFFNFHDCAFEDQYINVQNKFGNDTVYFSDSSFTFTGDMISGGLYPYILNDGVSYELLGLNILGQTTFTDVAINIINNYSSIIVKNPSPLLFTDTVNESYIRFHGLGGHDHTDSRIDAGLIEDGDLIYNSDLNITVEYDSSITLNNGIINADEFVITNSHRDSNVTRINGLSSGIYLDVNTPSVSGLVKTLNLGTYQMHSFNDKVYATTNEIVASGKSYVFESEDLYNWNAIEMSGFAHAVSGVSTIVGMTEHDGDLWMAANILVSGANSVAIQKLSDYESDTSRYLWTGGLEEHNASPYIQGITSTNDTLFLYGKTGSHLITGIPQWDSVKMTSSGIHATDVPPVSGIFDNNDFEYDKCFLRYIDDSYIVTDHLSGSGEITDYADYGHGGIDQTASYESLFGNGFNEVTSIIGVRGSYNGGNKRTFKQYKKQPVDVSNTVIDPILVFGNSYNYTNVTSGIIFAGNVPIVINTPGIVEDGDTIPIGHGAMSLFDNNSTVVAGSGQYQNLYYSGGYMNSAWTASGDYSCILGRNPSLPGYIAAPYCNMESLYYINDDVVNKLSYTDANNSGILIASGTYPNSDNKPTYYERPFGVNENSRQDGFWSNKSFNWHYSGGISENPNVPPEQTLEPTYYYCKPIKPTLYDGKVYAILDHDTGFVILSSNGTQYIDDGIRYTDIIVYEGSLYGVGNLTTEVESKTYEYRTTLRKIVGASSDKDIPIDGSTTFKEYRMVIHNNNLVISTDNTEFYVLKPSHKNVSKFK